MIINNPNVQTTANGAASAPPMVRASARTNGCPAKSVTIYRITTVRASARTIGCLKNTIHFHHSVEPRVINGTAVNILFRLEYISGFYRIHMDIMNLLLNQVIII